ncbi:MAG: hypothetical protein ACK5W9_11985 [Bdellovibrionales bacterium]
MAKKWELTKVCRVRHTISAPEMNQRLAEVLEILLSNKSQLNKKAFSEDFKTQLHASPLVQTKTKRKSA